MGQTSPAFFVLYLDGGTKLLPFRILQKSGTRNLYTVGVRIPNMFGFRMVRVCSDFERFGFRMVKQDGHHFAKNGGHFVRILNGPDHSKTEQWLA